MCKIGELRRAVPLQASSASRLLGLNLVRVMQEVEQAAVRIQRTRGRSTATIEELR